MRGGGSGRGRTHKEVNEKSRREGRGLEQNASAPRAYPSRMTSAPLSASLVASISQALHKNDARQDKTLLFLTPPPPPPPPHPLRFTRASRGHLLDVRFLQGRGHHQETRVRRADAKGAVHSGVGPLRRLSRRRKIVVVQGGVLSGIVTRWGAELRGNARTTHRGLSTTLRHIFPFSRNLSKLCLP